MKRKYTRMEAIKIPFDNQDIFTILKSTCFEIIANNVVPGTRVCQNPEDNTTYRWYGDNPFE